MNTEQPRQSTRPGRPRTRFFLVVLGVGVVLVGTAVFLWNRNVPAPTDAGSVPVVVVTSTVTVPPSPTEPKPLAASAGSAPAATSRATTSTSPQGRPRTAVVASSPSPASGSSGPATSGAPAVLHLPTLGVTAHVDPVDSTKGVLQVPDDISRVGWWQHSVSPGSATGSTVIDGHIDSAVAGEGALFHLGDLGPGDPVSITTSTGRVVHYRVQARRVYVKEQGLPADLFDQHGQPRLVIISCGGPFDSTIRSYEDNIAVFATPST